MEKKKIIVTESALREVEYLLNDILDESIKKFNEDVYKFKGVEFSEEDLIKLKEFLNYSEFEK